ncbi:MFS transporter [Dactylosporangium sp. NPDC005555]|uniref:MFS transporter n=1 Tax=Dactylosporangium sp. NPDC005555 TaxID=3154889 RepID=UPI0033B7150F
MQTLQVYYARDVLGNADYTIVLTILTTGAMFVVSPLIPKIVETFGKQRAYVATAALTAIGGLGIAFSPPDVPAVPLVSLAVYGMGIAAVQSLMWALHADTVEYGDWASGIRIEGANYAALSFTRKVGQGVGGALAAFGIGLGGYTAGAATQSAESLNAIRYVTGLGPAVFVGIGAATMLRYPLNEERFRGIVAELGNRRRERILHGVESDGER